MRFPRTFRRIMLALAAFLPLLAGFCRIAAAADFLDPDAAFKVSGELGTDRQVVLRWQIAKGYKLYRNSVKVTAAEAGAALGKPELPAGIVTTDPSTGEKLEIYHDRLEVRVPLGSAQAPITLSVEYQGCSEDGLCYPPATRQFVVDPSSPGPLREAAASSSQVSAGLPAPPSPPSASPAKPSAAAAASTGDGSLVQSTLRGGSLWKVVVAFLGFGLLLAFTPCLLPMVPILSSIIVGDGQASRSRSLLMAVAYCAGLSLVYTALGVVAGLAGEGLSGFLQQPAVLMTFSLLLVIMALSMFDVYELQIPVAIQNRLNRASGKLTGGSFVRVFIMGAISALVVGPCVAAPLAGTLVYISQTKDVVIGGVALFSMAVGMSVPLLLVGVSAGSLLPKAGSWMVGVKYLFGHLLLAVAIWIASPVLPVPVTMIAWGSLAILGAVFLGLFAPSREGKPSVGARFGRALAIVMLAIGVVEIVGAASGGGNVLSPFAGFRVVRGDRTSAGADDGPGFSLVRTEAELDDAIRAAGRPVMVDYSADWCVSCRELEEFTFSDPEVRERLEGMKLLRVDVTANSAEDRALMKRFGIFGPPAILFFDRDGREVPSARVDGFMNAAEFTKRLDQALSGQR